jgi:zinc carboxypeptidase
MKHIQYLLILFLLIILFTPHNIFADISVDADFPGGNIMVDKIEGDQIFLHQDLRDTKGDWFYWYFRVRGAEGRSLTFDFTKSRAIGVRGPAISLDKGKNWSWLGNDAVNQQSFHYTFPASASAVRFCFAMPYLESNLKSFLKAYQKHSHLIIETLCHSKKQRKIELLRAGRLDGQCDHRVLLTCRHHSCEMMANYSLEGVIDTILSDNDDGQWFRDHVEFLLIPFVDKDGVEDGDQGKNRIPHDHGRDYAKESIYPSVKTIRKFVPQWSQGKLHLTIDMHCPYISGSNNENLFFVGSPAPHNWERIEQFSKILENVQTGPLIFDKKNNIPYGQGWNTAANYGSGKSCGKWAAELPEIWLGTSVEIPYANANGHAVTAKTARQFGKDMAAAIRIFLEKNQTHY